MTTKIPTVQLKFNAAAPLVDASPAGAPVVTGRASDSTIGWLNLGADYPGGYTAFDVYEDGAPMVNGRTFQVSCFSTQLQTNVNVYHSSAPYRKIPPTFTDASFIPKHVFTRCNVPVVYITDGDTYTCFYTETPSGSSVAAFFKGKFCVAPRLGAPNSDTASDDLVQLPPFLVPVFIDAADIAASVLAGLGIPDSSTMGWNLFSCAWAPRGVVTSYILPGETGIVAPATLLDERPALGTYYALSNTVSVGVGSPPTDHMIVRLSDNKAGTNNQLGTFPGSACKLRTYRRADASAIYDWPGVFGF